MAKRLNKTQGPKPKTTPAEYSQVLRLYWQGEKESAIALISDVLAEGSDDQPELYYRLWIEILSDAKDEGSLKALQNHIKQGIHYKHPSWIPLLSLVGLIHYELGELEAARLTFRSMSKHNHNPYCRELQWVSTPLDESGLPEGLKPLQLVRNTHDFSHFKRATLAAKRSGDERSFSQLRREMRSVFAGHPLTREIRFHEFFGAKDFRKACLVAKSLRQSFPLNTEYQFYFAYTASQISRDKLALKEFLELNRRLDENDADVLCSLGQLLLKPSDQGLTQHQISRGKTYLRKAAEKLNSLGLSSAYPRTLLARLEEDTMDTSGTCWFLKLPQRQAYELHTRPLERIEFLQRALGEYVKQGDMCFFVSEGPAHSEEEPGDWRLLALYKAVSDPEWHHLHRWQTTLHLQIRLDVTVPIENMGQKSLVVKGSDRVGLYRIEREQLEKLEQGIRGYTLDDEAYQPFFDQWRRLIS